MSLKKIDPEVVWPVILNGMANGRSLASILRDKGMPSYAWATLQIRNDPELQRAYNQALETRGALLAEEIIELADQPMPEGLDGRELSAWVQRLKVQVDCRRWSAARLLPKVYGDRLDLSVTSTAISITQALQQADKRVIDLSQLEVKDIEQGSKEL